VADQHNHVWKRLFKVPKDSDQSGRISYLLAGYDRYFGCKECPAVGRKAKFSGFINPISDPAALVRRGQAAEWKEVLTAKGKTETKK